MIDIIIPVFNALNELKKCISSIIKYTNFSHARVILINDASTDPNVSPYLDTLSKNSFIIINHANNSGFSASVNDGIKLSKTNDVVLLNSDTIVTENWIEKLQQCAYSRNEIGLVVPLSNSGELCSVPYYCFDNPILPNNRSINSFAKIVEECSLREYPELPLAICFCTYIKRIVFEKTGYFDADTFKRGYGEDTDFSIRAQLLGFDTVMCDDLFIFHSGSTSFGKKNRTEEVQKKEVLLRNRFPYYTWLKDYYVINNPFSEIQKTIRFWSAYNNGKKNILAVSHRGFEVDSINNIGGTQFHVMDLKNALKQEYNIIVLSKGAQSIDLDIYIGSIRFVFKYKLSNPGHYVEYHNNEIENVFLNILTAFKIDLVHFHHIKYLSQKLPFIATSCGIPYCVTLHDYYFISPCLSLMKPDKAECTEIKDCNTCLTYNKELFTEFQPNSLQMIRTWNEISNKILSGASNVFAPSYFVKRKYSEFGMDHNITVLPHGYGTLVIDESEHISKCTIDSIYQVDDRHIRITGWAIVDGIPADELAPSAVFHIGEEQIVCNGYSISRTDLGIHFNSSLYINSGFMVQVSKQIFDLSDSYTIILQSNTKCYSYNYKKSNIVVTSPPASRKKFNVAFIGGISESKGSKVIIEMVKQTRSNPNIHWYIMGGCGDPELANLKEKNLTFTGWYDRQDIVALLKVYNIDLVCIPSMVAETFCYTLSEAYRACIPVVVSGLGALGERVLHDQTGWVIKTYNDPKKYVRKIIEAKNNKLEYNEIKKRIIELPDFSLNAMGKSYDKEFKKVLCDSPVDKSKIRKQDIEFMRKGFVQVENTEVEKLKSTLSEIQNSFTYKVVNKIQTTNFPGKKIAKATMRKIYWKLKK